MLRTLVGAAAFALCVIAGIPLDSEEKEANGGAGMVPVLDDDVVTIPEHAHVMIYEEPGGDWFISNLAYLSRAGQA